MFGLYLSYALRISLTLTLVLTCATFGRKHTAPVPWSEVCLLVDRMLSSCITQHVAEGKGRGFDASTSHEYSWFSLCTRGCHAISRPGAETVGMSLSLFGDV